MKAVSSKKRLALIGGFLIAFLLVLNVSTYVLYTRAKDYLDTELGGLSASMATFPTTYTLPVAADTALSSGNAAALKRIKPTGSKKVNAMARVFQSVGLEVDELEAEADRTGQASERTNRNAKPSFKNRRLCTGKPSATRG